MYTFNSQSDPSLYVHITIGTGSYIGSYTTSTTNMYKKDFTYRSVINSVDSSCKARTNCVLKFLEKFEKKVHCNESICTGLDEKTTDEKQTYQQHVVGLGQGQTCRVPCGSSCDTGRTGGATTGSTGAGFT